MTAWVPIKFQWTKKLDMWEYTYHYTSNILQVLTMTRAGTYEVKFQWTKKLDMWTIIWASIPATLL